MTTAVVYEGFLKASPGVIPVPILAEAASRGALRYNMIPSGQTLIATGSKLGLFTALLMFLNLTAIILTALAIGAFMVGNNVVGLGALGPAMAADVGSVVFIRRVGLLALSRQK